MAIAHNPSIQTNGLVAYYDVTNPKSWAGSGQWKDLTKNGHDLTMTGSISTAIKGGVLAWNFDATSKYFSVAISNDVGTSGNCTLEAWIYPEDEVSVGDRGTIILLTGGEQCYLSWNKSNQKLSGFWYVKSPNGYHETGAAMSRNQWHHVCQVWNQSDGTLYQYTDGVQTSVATVNTGINNTGLRIGMESEARQFSGGISVAKFYNVALTQKEVLNSFNSVRNRYSV